MHAQHALWTLTRRRGCHTKDSSFTPRDGIKISSTQPRHVEVRGNLKNIGTSTSQLALLHFRTSARKSLSPFPCLSTAAVGHLEGKTCIWLGRTASRAGREGPLCRLELSRTCFAPSGGFFSSFSFFFPQSSAASRFCCMVTNRASRRS